MRRPGPRLRAEPAEKEFALNNLKILQITTQDEFRKLHQLDKEKNGLIKMEPSSFTMRAGGSILHDFYTGIEKIFENIAKEVDRRVPTGVEWHSELIHQMTLEIPGLRPPILSAATAKKLREYLGFRHLFRKRYGFELDWKKMEGLLQNVPEVLALLEKDIGNFFNLIDSLPRKSK
jgi:hypothetical protein